MPIYRYEEVHSSFSSGSSFKAYDQGLGPFLANPQPSTSRGLDIMSPPIHLRALTLLHKGLELTRF